jgi:hypothetical protein
MSSIKTSSAFVSLVKVKSSSALNLIWPPLVQSVSACAGPRAIALPSAASSTGNTASKKKLLSAVPSIESGLVTFGFAKEEMTFIDPADAGLVCVGFNSSPEYGCGAGEGAGVACATAGADGETFRSLPAVNMQRAALLPRTAPRFA